MSYTRPTIEEIEARRAKLAPFDGWNERAFCQICAWMGIPRSYLDLGSGTGAMVNCARKLSSDAYGVDIINGPEGHFITHDLSEPMYLFRARTGGFNDRVFQATGEWQAQELNNHADFRRVDFDLITCLEVAEHLPLDAHETLVDSIARHLRPKPNMDTESGYVLFSAAPPGQAGEHHIGNRSAVEWRSMFYERGISFRDDYTRQLACLFGWVTGPASHWLAANLMVFDTGMR